MKDSRVIEHTVFFLASAAGFTPLFGACKTKEYKWIKTNDTKQKVAMILIMSPKLNGVKTNHISQMKQPKCHPKRAFCERLKSLHLRIFVSKKRQQKAAQTNIRILFNWMNKWIKIHNSKIFEHSEHLAACHIVIKYTFPGVSHIVINPGIPPFGKQILSNWFPT